MNRNIKGLEIIESKIQGFNRVGYNGYPLGTLCKSMSGKWIYSSRIGSFNTLNEAAESLLRFRCVQGMGLTEEVLLYKCRYFVRAEKVN